MPDRLTIANATLLRMENDLARLRRNPTDGPMLSRFAYDHGHTLVVDSKGKKDLLVENTVPLASDIARLLQHCSPAIVGELIRGYKLARAAGLLGDGFINPEAAKWLSRLGCGFSPPERMANGYKIAAKISEELRVEDRKPGGIPLIQGEKING